MRSPLDNTPKHARKQRVKKPKKLRETLPCKSSQDNTEIGQQSHCDENANGWKQCKHHSLSFSVSCCLFQVDRRERRQSARLFMAFSWCHQVRKVQAAKPFPRTVKTGRLKRFICQTMLKCWSRSAWRLQTSGCKSTPEGQLTRHRPKACSHALHRCSFCEWQLCSS